VTKASIFLLMITGYIVLGVTESMILMKRRFVEVRLQRAQDAAASAAPPAIPEEATVQEEEVLRELGAFDQPEETGGAGDKNDAGSSPVSSDPGTKPA
jgi:hypothetical protein